MNYILLSSIYWNSGETQFCMVAIWMEMPDQQKSYDVTFYFSQIQPISQWKEYK